MQVLCQTTGALAQHLVRRAKAGAASDQRVIHQTRQRVVEGAKVPSDEKVLSLVEPHTRAIPRHTGPARRVRAAGYPQRAWRAGS